MNVQEEENEGVGELIRLARKQLKMTQVQFAEAIGVDQTAVSRWEKDKARAAPSTLVAIGELLRRNGHSMESEYFYEEAGVPTQTVPIEMIPPAPLDRDLLAYIIGYFDRKLTAQRKKLPSDKFAQLVVLAYEACHSAGHQDADILDRLLAVA